MNLKEAITTSEIEWKAELEDELEMAQTTLEKLNAED